MYVFMKYSTDQKINLPKHHMIYLLNDFSL